MEEIIKRLEKLIWLMEEVENTYVKNELCILKDSIKKLNWENKKQIKQIKQILCEKN